MIIQDLKPGDKFALLNIEGEVVRHGIGSTTVNYTKQLEWVDGKFINKPQKGVNISLEMEVVNDIY